MDRNTLIVPYTGNVFPQLSNSYFSRSPSIGLFVLQSKDHKIRGVFEFYDRYVFCINININIYIYICVCLYLYTIYQTYLYSIHIYTCDMISYDYRAHIDLLIFQPGRRRTRRMPWRTARLGPKLRHMGKVRHSWYILVAQFNDEYTMGNILITTMIPKGLFRFNIFPKV